MTEAYYYVFILLLSIVSMIWIVCLSVKNAELKDQLEFRKTAIHSANNELFDEYFIYCRDLAMKKRKETMDRYAAMRKDGFYPQLWEVHPEQAIGEELELQRKLSECKSIRKFMRVFYREQPDVVYTFLCAQEEFSSFDPKTEDKQRQLFCACLEKYHLDVESKRHAFDYEK